MYFSLAWLCTCVLHDSMMKCKVRIQSVFRVWLFPCVSLFLILSYCTVTYSAFSFNLWTFPQHGNHRQKVRGYLTLNVMALAWTVSQSKSCLACVTLFFKFFFLADPPPPPFTCILPLNTNKIGCVANSQIGSNPSAVKRLRLIWFFLWFHRKLDRSQGADTPWTRLGDKTAHNRRQWSPPH